MLYRIGSGQKHFCRQRQTRRGDQAFDYAWSRPRAPCPFEQQQLGTWTVRLKAVYNRARLLNDPVYNMQMGAAELSNLLSGYNGSYILTFAGYNAGRGRVRQWIAAYGDPRDPHVDPVDWVERIPISETRNYVARIMENLQVYRAPFGGSSRLLIEADLKRGGTN